MDVSVNAEVTCADEVCGQVAYVIVDPVRKQVTHVVVREKSFPHAEWLVPLDLVSASSPKAVRLSCTRAELVKLEPFTRLDFVEQDPATMGEAYGMMPGLLMWPYVAPADHPVPQVTQLVPQGERVVRRGTHVYARDGRVGRVDELMVDPDSGRITHLVLREGHLWGKAEITIPVSEIDRIEEERVYLKLDKQQIEALPRIPIRRQ